MTNTEKKEILDSDREIDPALMDSFFEQVDVPSDEENTPIIDPSKFVLLYDPNMSSDTEDPPLSPNIPDSKLQENNGESNGENNVENNGENKVENNKDTTKENPSTDSKSNS